MKPGAAATADDLLALIPANTKENIAIFSSAGKIYVMKAFDLPSGSGFGEPVQHLFKFGDGAAAVAGKPRPSNLPPKPEVPLGELIGEYNIHYWLNNAIQETETSEAKPRS